MTERLSRRNFLLYGGATLAGVTLGEIGRRTLLGATAEAAAWRKPGVEAWRTSVCRECPAACGVRVRLVDDVPVKLDGNPLCPVSRGRLCAKGQAALESYFDPDRLMGPARRVGERGENRWEPIDWETAIGLLAGSLEGRSGGDAGILAIAAGEMGLESATWASFWQAAGADVAWTALPTAAHLRPSLRSLTGVDGDPLFDLANASYVLSFGAPIAEDWLSPVWSQRSFGNFRRGRSQSRGRLVQVESRRSPTARKADEWVAIPTEQQTYLAYGIASVLMRESRLNREFLESHGRELAQFEQWVVQGYRTDATSAATGVPVVTILRLARELATSPQAVVTVAADAAPALVDAVFALNALIGSLDRPGGVLATRPGSGDARADASEAVAAVASGERAPRIVAFRDSSVFRGLRNPLGLARGLASAELVVSFSPYLDEAAMVADLLLPRPTPLESWHGVTPAPAVEGQQIALARPAVESRLDTRDLVEVLAQTAEAAGGEMASATAFPTSEALVGAELDRLWEVRRGAPYADEYETQWVRRLETGGWWERSASSRAAFGRAVLGAGGWGDPLIERGYILQSLEQLGGLRFPPPPVLPFAGRAASAAPAPVLTGVSLAASSAVAAQEGDESYPLQLEVFTPSVVNTMGNLNQPVLFELLGQPGGLPWQPWAELSPETASEFGVEHGVMVQVASPYGTVDMPALHVEGMPPGLLAVALVPSGRAQGRWAQMAMHDVRALFGASGDAAVGGVAIRRL